MVTAIQSLMFFGGGISAVILIILIVNYAMKRNDHYKLKMQGANNESILGMISSASSRFRWLALFFTTDGIIIAVTIGTLASLTSGRYGSYSKFQSKAMASTLAQMKTEDIIRDNRSNFFIPNNSIKSVMIKEGMVFDPHIVIITDRKKYEYTFAIQTVYEVLDILRSAVPDKLIVSQQMQEKYEMHKKKMELGKDYVEIQRERWAKGEICTSEFDKLTDK